MYRASLSEGLIECDSYEMGEHGVTLYNEGGDLLAFVPYEHLVALTNVDTYPHDVDEPSVM